MSVLYFLPIRARLHRVAIDFAAAHHRLALVNHRLEKLERLALRAVSEKRG